MTTLSDYQELVKQGYNRIPVRRNLFADLHTPLSCYLKVADAPFSYLFESLQGGEKWGRYSIIGLPCRMVIRARGKQVTVSQNGQQVLQQEVANPLQWLQEYQQQFSVAELEDAPRFNGGFVGYFGYDAVRYVEPRLWPCELPDSLQCPDILLMVSDEIILFDNFKAQASIIVYADPSQADAWEKTQQRVDAIEEKLQQGKVTATLDIVNDSPISEDGLQSNIEYPEYEKAVLKVKDYIVAGDVMQVVFSRRLTAPFKAPPINLYRALRYLNPSPYLYYLNLGDFHIVGSSPEVLVRLEEDTVTVRPLAGTRRRGKTEAEDLALEKDLLDDPKEVAEHLMLIDLGRNDVGRIAQTHSVEVTEQMKVERYSHVMHISSNVIGKLKPELNALDVLSSVLPAGTLSGASKVRAMEVIDEIETVKRGIYGGAVGYIAWNGQMDVAIAIRTAVIKDGQIVIQTGSGLVADSNPKAEWEETVNKARALFRAATMAEEGL